MPSGSRFSDQDHYRSALIRRSGVAFAWVLLLARAVSAQETLIREEVGWRLDTLFRAAEAEGFHGNALVARGGEIVLLRGYGVANHATKVPFSPSTVVQIGSNTKDFTKVAIYQLVEAGRLRLTDSLPRLFDGVPDDKRGITVEHLLSHTAGFPVAIGPDRELLGFDGWQERLLATPLLFAPGTRREYSNAGYSVLAAIVEALSGRSYDQYLSEHVFQPAQMQETGLLMPGFDPARLAHGYSGGEDRGTMLDRPRLNDGHGWNLRGNGGLLSTLSDMFRFYRALRDSTLLHDPAHRHSVVGAEGPSVLAGSDRVNFFLYGSFPREGVEVLIATNHAESQGGPMLRRLMPLLGIQLPDPSGVTVTAPSSRSLPDHGRGRTVAAWLAAFNSGDTVAMRRFLEEHGAPDPDAPPLGVRLQRHRAMQVELGRLTVEGVQEILETLVLRARSEHGPVVTLTFLIEAEAPFRMRSLRVEVN